MPKFRKKPIVVEAFLVPKTGEDRAPFCAWARRVGLHNYKNGRDEAPLVHTLEGKMTAEAGDWIIRRAKGEFYPCKPAIFKATYEPV